MQKGWIRTLEAFVAVSFLFISSFLLLSREVVAVEKHVRVERYDASKIYVWNESVCFKHFYSTCPASFFFNYSGSGRVMLLYFPETAEVRVNGFPLQGKDVTNLLVNSSVNRIDASNCNSVFVFLFFFDENYYKIKPIDVSEVGIEMSDECLVRYYR